MNELDCRTGHVDLPGAGVFRRGWIRASAVLAAALIALGLTVSPVHADQVGPSSCPGPAPCHLISRTVWIPTSEGHNVGCVSDTNPFGYYRTYEVYQGQNWVDKDGHEYWGRAWISMDKGGNYPYYTQSTYNTFDCEDTNISPGE